MRRPIERLRDMIEAIEAIERYASQGKDVFENDELIQVWIVHHLEILGEAAARLGKSFHKQYPEIPWEKIVAMRNILIHEYFGIDLQEVWNTVEYDLPELKQALQALLRSLSLDENPDA